jgi:hypothetical protein
MKYLAKPPNGPVYELSREELTNPRVVRNLSINQTWVIKNFDRWIPIHQFLQLNEKTKTAGREKHNTSDISTEFFCVACATRLRIPLSSGVARCPNCRTEYQVRLERKNPDVFLVVPQRIQRSDSKAKAEASQRFVTPAVKSALSVLGLPESATFAEARDAYRKLIQGYHPDKVSHLGAELRNMAEIKTKELNAAFRVIEEFQSDHSKT